tara:strand:- start:945 stop:2288 length:1344 start_codon:yes stop_codon:yes gene_type:complete
MKKNTNILIMLLITIVLILGILYFTNTISQQEQKILEQEQTIYLKDQKISQQEEFQDSFGPLALSLELYRKEIASDIEINKTVINLSDNLIMKKFELLSGFYHGINMEYPGSGFIDFHEDNIIALSSRGVLAFRKEINDDKESFKQIKNNINEFIGLKQYQKKNWFSLKDILIFNNLVFISYTEEIKEDCWNTSIVYGNMDYENIQFKKLFSPKECVHSTNNVDKQFNALQSGGKIISLDNNHILFSTGEYRSRYLAQDNQSVNGKLIRINISTNDYEIISMGHRNPQGLYFDKNNNFILETEHGPQGGDEINLINIDSSLQNEIPNYGWPISSAGEHYGGRSEENTPIYEKYPLHNSHSEYGFKEPLKSFVPSIGISEIVKIGPNKYVFGSMKDKSIYFFELSEQKELINLVRVEVFERIRDLKFRNNQLFLFLENTASIGVINLD